MASALFGVRVGGCRAKEIIVRYGEAAQLTHYNTQGSALVIYGPQSWALTSLKCFPWLVGYQGYLQQSMGRRGHSRALGWGRLSVFWALCPASGSKKRLPDPSQRAEAKGQMEKGPRYWVQHSRT